MYQRLAMAVSTASNPEHEGHENPDQLVGQKEEDSGEPRHDEDHHGGDHGFLARRPGDLLGLGADLLQEFYRTDLRHALTLSSDVCSDRPERRVGPQNLAVIYTLISGKAPRPA